MITTADLEDAEEWAKGRREWTREVTRRKVLALLEEVRRLRALLNLAVGGNRPRSDT